MSYSKIQSGQVNKVNYPNVREIRMMISTYNESANLLQNFYLVPSYMGLLNVGRKELQHSRFLAWLFDKKYFDQNSVNSPLFYLLDIAMRRAVMQDKVSIFDEKLYNNIIFRDFDIIDSTIILEDHFIDNNSKPRSTDILLTLNCRYKGNSDDFTILICIENKVLSKEHDNQTEAYFDYYNEYKGKKIYLYLTPLSSSKLDDYDHLTQDEKCKCNNFIQINYQDIVDFILEPLMKIENKFSQKYFIIDDYIKTLRYPIMEEKESKKTIMAMGKEERELLTEFWNTNHELIELAIRALGEDSSDNNLSNELIEELQATTEEKRRRFIVNGDNSKRYGKINIAKRFAHEFFDKNQQAQSLDNLNILFRKEIKKEGETEYFTQDDQGTYLEYVGKLNNVNTYFKAGIWGNTGAHWPKLKEYLEKKNQFFTIQDAQ